MLPWFLVRWCVSCSSDFCFDGTRFAPGEILCGKTKRPPDFSGGLRKEFCVVFAPGSNSCAVHTSPEAIACACSCLQLPGWRRPANLLRPRDIQQKLHARKRDDDIPKKGALTQWREQRKAHRQLLRSRDRFSSWPFLSCVAFEQPILVCRSSHFVGRKRMSQAN